MGEGITVQVRPRSARTEVATDERGTIVIRVRAAPEGGRATSEAANALAVALGLPRSAVTLRRGARSRTKVFDVDGIDVQAALALLHRL
jgi:uncharacterized protein YggU (UPF0235/DUF167 family)